jgi:hypothetical protein
MPVQASNIEVVELGAAMADGMFGSFNQFQKNAGRYRNLEDAIAIVLERTFRQPGNAAVEIPRDLYIAAVHPESDCHDSVALVSGPSLWRGLSYPILAAWIADHKSR